MKILSMTATFGKLERQSLSLQPELNIIEAPNEWGKSTWCAFIAAMLYGVDTRERSTSDHLADKEHYAPWSGSPMSGRMDISWNGRDITIERSTRGRIPMGHFRAYETTTGLDVPELTAANCGPVLLGVERSVFLRTAFLRLSDMPVTQDDALRTRLNALVTTGDESNTATMLGSKLRELKNSCRYNRSGLLPQAEAEKAELEHKLKEINALLEQSQQLRKRQQELEDFAAQLENHRKALQYVSAQENAARLVAAHSVQDDAARRLEALEQRCSGLAPREAIEKDIHELQRLQNQLSSAVFDLQLCPVQQNAPGIAIAQAESDSRRFAQLRAPLFLILAVLALLCTATAAALISLNYKVGYYLLPIAAAAAVLFLTIHLIRRTRLKKLAAQYSSFDPEQWISDAKSYAMDTARRQELESCIDQLNGQILTITGGEAAAQCLMHWQEFLQTWDQLYYVRREYQQASSHTDALTAAIHPVTPPELPDVLTYTAPETTRLMADTSHQLRQLQLKLGQCQGRMEQLGPREETQHQLEQVTQRIRQLEDHYAALTLAQQTLSDAREELQRRFAPQITAHARRILSRLTDNRYERLSLDRDLNLLSGAANEDVLHGTRWRSDGTVDQLYLALRLAVSQALIPDAPLILDDALVRFDDIRLKAALDILKEESGHKQVILFTCQSREKNML